jgi:hypothetical protein
VKIADLFVPLGEAALSMPVEVHLEQVRLVEPDVHYTRPSPELAALLAGPERGEAGESAPAESETAPRAPPPRVRIDLLEIQGGSVRFEDEDVSPRFDAEVRELEASARSVAWPENTVGDLAMTAILPGGSTLAVNGSVGRDDGKIDVDLVRLPLPPANSYASSAGLQVARGELSLDSKVQVEGVMWRLDNDVVLHELHLDPEGSEELLSKLTFPLGPTLALLRDASGDIALAVPIELDEGETDVDLMAIVGGALKTALVGAASVPLKAVGGIFGSDGSLRLEPIPAPAGTAELGADAAGRIDGLADLLESRPGMTVTLAGRAGPADRDPLALQLLVEQVAKGGDLPELEGDDAPGFLVRRRIHGALVARGEGDAVELGEEDAASLERYVAAANVPDARYEALAEARVERVERALLATERIDSSRIEHRGPADRGDPGVLLDFTGTP